MTDSAAQTLEEAFPTADPGVVPLGNKILVQLRTVKRFTASGIALPSESQDFEKANTAVGKVLALGPLAYKNRGDMTQWPEGAWAKPGDYVRVPKFNGDRWEWPVSDEPNAPAARYVIYNDYEVISKITRSPLDFRDYV